MQETTQQYVRRILGLMEGKNAMDVLAASPRQVARLIKGVTKKRLSKRPSPKR